MGMQNGPAYGFDFAMAALGPSRSGGNPANYFDTTMPTAGRSFDLGSVVESVGGKRARIDGDLESEFSSWATRPMGKRARRDGYADIAGYTSALANEEPFNALYSNDVARRFGFSMSMLKKNHFSTIGFMTNPTIPGNETHLKHLPGYEAPGEYDVIIIRVHLRSEPQVLKESAAEDFIVDATQYTAYTLTGFNHYLASVSRKPTTMTTDPIQYMRLVQQAESGRNFAAFEQGYWHKPETVWRYFHIGGVVNSERFADGTSSVTRHEYGMDPANRTRRDLRVNIIKLGRAFVVGLAPPNRPAGTNIGFITKRVNRPSIYRVDTTRDLTRADETFMALKTANTGTQHSDYPMQVIPWTSGRGHIRPSLDELEFTDPFGITRRGVYKHFAVIHKENVSDADVGHYELATDLALARSQTPTDVFISL